MGGGGKSGGGKQEKQGNHLFTFSNKEGSEEEARALFAKRQEDIQNQMMRGNLTALAAIGQGARAGQVYHGPLKSTQGLEQGVWDTIDVMTETAQGVKRKINKLMAFDHDLGSPSNQLNSGNMF